MRKNILSCLLIILFTLTGAAIGGCSSIPQKNTTPNNTAKKNQPTEDESYAKPQPGQSLYNSMTVPGVQLQQGFYNHGFSSEQLLDLTNKETRDSDNFPE